ncbi:UNVERIFIED_CONTAM: hypothetical protein Slati_3876600 [Sesamum latifolium]|uniref:Uncharacterized protein n=1 Tax=Sesamum latifolium TaxID=2727402 RepID=A0AAW2TLX7_9LAMI
MSSTDESVSYVGESQGDDPSEATSRRSGSPLPSYVAGRRWSLRQVARRLLDESSSEEEGVGEEEVSSPGEMESPPREERVSSGHRGSRPEGSAWVACGLRAGLRFPIPSFFYEASRDLKVPLNQLVPNSIRLLAAFSIVLRYNNLIPTSGLFYQCFQLKRTKPGVFHFAPRRGVSYLPTPSPPKHWKGDFFFILPPLPWNIPRRWIWESPPPVQISLADRSSNFCGLLDRLNERPYDCKELVDERLLSHFGLSPRGVPLREPLDDIMFSKYLRDEHRAALTPPATRSSRGTSFSSDQRGKRPAPALPGSSSKRSKPSSSAFLHSSSTRPVSTPSPPPPPRDLGARSSKSPPSSSGEVYTHLMLSLEKEEAPGRAADIMKGALPTGDKRLLSSLSSEDLD